MLTIIICFAKVVSTTEEMIFSSRLNITSDNSSKTSSLSTLVNLLKIILFSSANWIISSEFKDIVLSVQAIDYKGNIITIPSKKIKFNYRESDLSNDLLFLSASFLGKKSNIQDISNKIQKFKKEKEISQPSKIKTGGSTFKNPINYTKHKVWELIKQSVPENTKYGDAFISSHHANFFVNKKEAKFHDMMMLIDYVKERVKKKFNINLELEIKIIK